MIDEGVVVVPILRPVCLVLDGGVCAVRTVQRVRAQTELRRTCVFRSRSQASNGTILEASEFE